jgi:pseudoazurin
MRSLLRVIVLLSVALTSSWVSSEEHIVKGVVTEWKPLVTFAQPGDTVKFMNMIGHDTEALEGMIPEGAEGWKSKLGEEGFSITVDKEGAYIYKCNPHISTGMVGTIVVGDVNPPANLEKIEENLANIKVAKNMVNRAIKKMKKALEAKVLEAKAQ